MAPPEIGGTIHDQSAPTPRPRLCSRVQMGQEAARFRVVVGDGDPRAVEGVQHRAVQLDQRPVPPQRPVGGGVEPEPLGDRGSWS